MGHLYLEDKPWFYIGCISNCIEISRLACYFFVVFVRLFCALVLQRRYVKLLYKSQKYILREGYKCHCKLKSKLLETRMMNTVEKGALQSHTC
jgi:hypothetical protein